ncbi:MAG: DUF4012 domain-containing protein [Actinomycetales bacterium]|nr:DUF4012 domain-containing protein [Actinomycetales bacterium]
MPDVPDPSADGPSSDDEVVARPGRRRLWLRVLGGAALLVVLAGAWLGWRGWQVWSALAPVEPALSGLQSNLSQVDRQALTEATAGLPEAAARAHAATSDPVWRAAEHLPWLGAQLRAVSAVTDAIRTVAVDVVPVLDDVAGTLDPATLAPSGGRVDVQALAAAAPGVHRAATAAVEARDQVDAVDAGPLVSQLADRVVRAQKAMDELAGLLGTADHILGLAPAMLGADGPRQYLLLVVNPAELRGLGGIVGSVAVLDVDDGAISLGDYASSRSFGSFDSAVVPLSDAELSLYGDRLGRYLQDVTMAPSLPRAAEIAAAMWKARTGDDVDGVVTIDPVALGYLLRAVGGVTVGDVTLNADNAARTLLLDAYLRFPDADASDAFFGTAATAVFRALVGGDADARVLLDGVRQAVDDRRLGLWSAHPDEQAVIGSSGVGLEFGPDADPEAAGVFLDDGTKAKIDYFLGVTTGTELSCDRAPAVATVTVDLASNTPDNLAELPQYVTGKRAGTSQTNLTIYSPVGGRVLGVEADGVALPSTRTTTGGREAVAVTVVLPPGGSRSVVVYVGLPAGQTSLGLRVSPTVSTPGLVPATSCGSG